MAVEQLIKNLTLSHVTRSSFQVHAVFKKEDPHIEITLNWSFEYNSPLIDGCYEFFSSSKEDVWRITELFSIESGQTMEWRISKTSGHYWTWRPA